MSPRRFRLLRNGGIGADFGVVFDDGTCVVHLAGARTTTAVYDDTQEALARGGIDRSRFRWIDGVQEMGERDALAVAQQTITQQHGHRMAAELAATLEIAVNARGAGSVLAALRAERDKAG